VGGQKFAAPAEIDVRDLTFTRNQYLHAANVFPTDAQMRLFLNQTIRVIGEAISFAA
jgi:hypothetical protein